MIFSRLNFGSCREINGDITFWQLATPSQGASKPRDALRVFQVKKSSGCLAQLFYHIIFAYIYRLKPFFTGKPPGRGRILLYLKVGQEKSVLLIVRRQEAGNADKPHCSNSHSDTSFMPLQPGNDDTANVFTWTRGEQARLALVGELGAQWAAGWLTFFRIQCSRMKLRMLEAQNSSEAKLALAGIFGNTNAAGGYQDT